MIGDDEMVMRGGRKFWLLLTVLPGAGLLGEPAAWAQSLSHGLSQGQQPSQQQIQQFCANWGQLSGSQRKQYQDQYDEYCDRPSVQPETTIIQPDTPQQQQPQQQQPSQKPEEPEEPQKPAEPEAPAKPEPEPEIEPARPEPAIPEPAPRRVDLVGELALAGSLARQPGERQRLRVTVENRGSDVPGSNRLWARVLLSDREVSRRGASAGAFSFSGARQGRPVRLPGVPGPGRSREVTAEVPLPAGTPDGNYWWCMQVDTRQQIEETNEGNNVACAPKVVALGKEPDSSSKLSGLFGSKVDKLKAQHPGSARKTGLLHEAEFDRLENMLTKTGVVAYDIFTEESGSGLTGERKRGLLLLRRPEDLVATHGRYYSDGRGNLVRIGQLGVPAGEDVPYALTLFAGGGLHLMVDTNEDGIVDLGVSEGLKDGVGFLSRPGLDAILECMKQITSKGTSAAVGLPKCLAGGPDDDSGSGTNMGVGGGLGSQLDDMLSPDCSEQGPGPPAQPDVAKTPDTPAPVPVPYPNTGGDTGHKGGKSMPGPIGPGGTPSPSGNDPRCGEPSLWNRLHTEQCANNMVDCLNRMSDPIYAATGGRCETVTGPDDAERVECKGNDSVARCIEGGGTPQECTEKHAGDGGGTAPSPDDDIFRNDRGELTYGVIDVHPFGATLAAMCRKAGGIGPCGDPSPAMDDRVKGIRSAAPEASR